MCGLRCTDVSTDSVAGHGLKARHIYYICRYGKEVTEYRTLDSLARWLASSDPPPTKPAVLEESAGNARGDDSLRSFVRRE